MADTTKAPDQREAAAREKHVTSRSMVVRRSAGLIPYGTPEELAELVNRVKFMLPGAKNWKPAEVWALCQAAFATGLNPVTQECTWINGFFPQIRGLRRKGHEQLDEIFPEGAGRPDLQFIHITSAVDRESLHIPDGALAYKCIGRIPAKVRLYAENAKTLAAAGAPWDRIEALLGQTPVSEGYGYVTAEEMEKLDNPRWYHKCSVKPELNTVERKATGGGKWKGRELRGFAPCPDCAKETYAEPPRYPHTQRARKRAEAHFWKQEADLPFDIEPSGAGLGEVDSDLGLPDGPVVDAGWTELDDLAKVAADQHLSGEEFEREAEALAQAEDQKEEWATATPDERQAQVTVAKETLYPSRPEQTTSNRPWSPDDVRQRFKEKAEYYGKLKPAKDQRTHVAMLLKQCFDGTDVMRDDMRHGVQDFLAGKPSLEAWDGGELTAALKWLDARQDRLTAKWAPAPMAITEARAIWNQYIEKKMAEAGERQA
jgi:hypothetical protein